MKFIVHFKTPDALDYAIKDATEYLAVESNDPEEAQWQREEREEKLKEFAAQWMRHEEYITVEFDTHAGTAVVTKA